MTTQTQPERGPLPLRCLGGRGAPPELLRDANLVTSFPSTAQRAFWMLLVPTLPDEPDPSLQGQLEAFARQHELGAEPLSRALRAHRFLLREAATRHLPKEDFAADLVDVAGGELPGRRLFEAIMPGYDLGCQSLMRERVGAALAAHGTLLERVDWRLDEMVLGPHGSIDGARVGLPPCTPVAGARRDRLTLQVLPDTLERLETACRTMRGLPAREEP